MSKGILLIVEEVTFNHVVSYRLLSVVSQTFSNRHMISLNDGLITRFSRIMGFCLGEDIRLMKPKDIRDKF